MKNQNIIIVGIIFIAIKISIIFIFIAIMTIPNYTHIKNKALKIVEENKKNVYTTHTYRYKISIKYKLFDRVCDSFDIKIDKNTDMKKITFYDNFNKTKNVIYLPKEREIIIKEGKWKESFFITK